MSVCYATTSDPRTSQKCISLLKANADFVLTNLGFHSFLTIEIAKFFEFRDIGFESITTENLVMLTTEESTQWDVQNFELCVRKILEHSGFKIIRAASALKNITFLAESRNDAGKLHGVSCIAQGETLGREDLEAIVEEGNSLSCQSNFVISLVPISPDATAWSQGNNKISLVNQRTFLHSYQQLPDGVKSEIENLVTTEPANELSDREIPAGGPAPHSKNPVATETGGQADEPPISLVREAEASDSPPIQEDAEFSSNHHHSEPAAASKKRVDSSKSNWKMWLMISGGALIGLFVLVNLGAVVVRALSKPGSSPGKEGSSVALDAKASKTPDVADPIVAVDEVSSKNETGESVSGPVPSAPDKIGPVVSDPFEPASEIPDGGATELAHKASGNSGATVPGENSPAMIDESPFAAANPDAPSITAAAFAPSKFSDNKVFDYVDLKIPPDAPTRESAEWDELELILKSIWDLDKLEGDPFFDLGQAILIRNLADRRGPLSKEESMALWALGGKLEDYPHLGCGAISILPPQTVPHFLNTLDPMIRILKDPFLSFQVASTKAGSSMGGSQPREEALNSLKKIFQTVEPDQLPDSIAFFLVAGEFAGGLRSAAPDEFINLVEESSAIPGWLKDYVGGKALYSRPGKDRLVRVAEMINKFESSWKSNPGHPAAAAELIMLNSTDSGGEFSEIRLWFDRSIKAQADYKAAYFNFAKALAENGDPSARLEIEFGKSCCRTGRFDTTVPLTLIDAHTLRREQSGKTPKQYWSSLDESDIKDLKVLFQKLGETNHLPYEAAIEKSLESVIWYFVGDEEISTRCWKEENFVFDPGAFDTLKLPERDRKIFAEFVKINGH